MSIAAIAPRGGVVENFDGTPRALVLRLGEIERFEDAHRGIFEVWDGFFAGGKVVSMSEALDLVALGLVGGGMTDVDADKLVRAEGAAGLPRIRAIASGLLGAAFYPDAVDDADDDDAPPEKPTGVATAPEHSASENTSAPQRPADSDLTKSGG